MNVLDENTPLPEYKLFDKDLIFHAYWNGPLSSKHLESIRSCSIINKKKVILWTEHTDGTSLELLSDIMCFCEIRPFDWHSFMKDTPLHSLEKPIHKKKPFYSDYVRMALLWRYGGVWFDLDVLWLSPLDGILHKYGHLICAYRWERQNYPNQAIFISLEKEDQRLKGLIDILIKRGAFGFQEGTPLYYSTKVDLTVLPCAWFDPGWTNNQFKRFFKSQKINESLLKDLQKTSVCYHWHNQWTSDIEPHCMFLQIVKQVCQKSK